MHPLRELSEIATYFRYALSMGNELQNKDFFDRVTPENPPILLIHGFLGTRGAMFPLELRLRRDNFVVFSINLGIFNVADIRKSALKIHDYIEKMIRKADIGKIDIIGHSMGGLIGAYYVKKLGGHQHVRKLITTGTPHDGTWVALAGVGALGLLSPSTWQMIPGSLFLKELDAAPLPPHIQMVSIAGTQDFVVPSSRSSNNKAKKIYLNCGHAGLATSSKVYNVIRDILLDNEIQEEDV